MSTDNKNLYPTPERLASKMISLVNWKIVKTVLEPSAGLGHLVEAVQNKDGNARYSNYDVSCIEIDNKCRNVLLQKNMKVIDSDFLAYNGLEQFDLVIANFPFSDGDKHLHKAIDILFSGQVVCLLNAETLKNPYSNSRKDLVKKLQDLDATVEYIENAFVDADRTTGVEVALVYISKIRDVETDLFNNMNDVPDIDVGDIKESNEIATKDDIFNIVAQYNQTKENVTNQIMDFYKNYRSVGNYLSLNILGLSDDELRSEKYQTAKDLTGIMKHKLNQFAIQLKREYWLKAIGLKEIGLKLTSQKKKELAADLNQYCHMDFTVANIKIFIENLKGKYPKMIDEAIEYIFDKFTEYAFRDSYYANNEYKKNIHMYNGWKTNQAFKVEKKVILPFTRGSYLSYDKVEFFDDIDLVFNYFDDKNLQNEVLEYKENKYSYNEGKTGTTTQTSKIVEKSLDMNITKKIVTRYFTLNFYAKGTVHFLFNDLELMRKFNIFVAKKRGWLPSDYGYTKARDTNNDFETEKEYKQYGNELAINTSNVLLLGA